MKRLIVTSLLLVSPFFVFAQKKEYKPVVIAFYNLENLYDTVDNSLTSDEEFLPNGVRNYNTAIYFDKLGKLATVISQIGTEINADGPAILGVAEVENDTVMHDLVKQELIKKRNYQVVHYDSKDLRGVDVGLLYNPKYFTLITSDKLFVQLPGGSKDSYFTRDILWVKGKLDGEVVHIYVNHWPSRVGGEKRSAPARNAAAAVCKHHIDSIAKIEPDAKIIVMGDLNDDPVNESVTKVIGARPQIDEVSRGGFYNPWTDLYKKGYGTIAYQDAWGLFDQILVSYPWLNKNQDGLFFYQNHIFKRDYMTENKGRYKGYPMRTWDGNSYRGGYCDHFPTYLVMLKEVKPEKKGF
ncbi:MAG: endonuclease/exonuclease/phosphatase [Chitinophagaceae bacterium]|nr:endonuclease/exonuclease/phosphatase [Chitinophagaceae bacterium]